MEIFSISEIKDFRVFICNIVDNDQTFSKNELDGHCIIIDSDEDNKIIIRVSSVEFIVHESVISCNINFEFNKIYNSKYGNKVHSSTLCIVDSDQSQELIERYIHDHTMKDIFSWIIDRCITFKSTVNAKEVINKFSKLLAEYIVTTFKEIQNSKQEV